MTPTQHTQSLEGQFDALGNLAPDALAGLAKWWIRKGKPAVADVASPRSLAQLAQMRLELAAPRLA